MQFDLTRSFEYHSLSDFINKVSHRIQKKISRARFKYEYDGNKVQCPICRSTFKKFGMGGHGKTRPNSRCLKCNSLERHRLIWLFLDRNKSIFDSATPKKVLHFAPERVFYTKFSGASNINYFPVDLFPEIYNNREGDKVRKADITALPFEDGFFDMILCSHVLEHIPDDRLAMSELFRVLNKENGWGIFQVPLDYNREETYEDLTITEPEEREKAFGQVDHVRWYGRDYPDRLASVGFKVEVCDPKEMFSKDEISRFGLDKDELLYVGGA